MLPQIPSPSWFPFWEYMHYFFKLETTTILSCNCHSCRLLPLLMTTKNIFRWSSLGVADLSVRILWWWILTWRWQNFYTRLLEQKGNAASCFLQSPKLALGACLPACKWNLSLLDDDDDSGVDLVRSHFQLPSTRLYCDGDDWVLLTSWGARQPRCKVNTWRPGRNKVGMWMMWSLALINFFVVLLIHRDRCPGGDFWAWLMGRHPSITIFVNLGFFFGILRQLQI